MSQFIKHLALCSFVIMLTSSHIHTTNLQEIYIVFTRYINNYAQVGEIAPISEKSGYELAKFVGVATDEQPRNYLEAGGGCGAVSICIAKSLRPQDHLDVIEIDPVMYDVLVERLREYSNVAVHCCSILDWQSDLKYDAIISTLPFNSLGVDFTQATLKHFQSLANVSCILSYVEYPIVGQVLQHFYGSDRKKMFRNVQSFMQNFRAERLHDQATVYFNVPPLNVYHLSLAD